MSKDVDASTPATWQEWKSIKEERDINGCKKQVMVTKKITHGEHSWSLWKLTMFSQQPKFECYQINMHHQQSYYKQLRDSLQPDERMIHIDYTENYLCMSAREVQAAHFSTSHRQIIMQTGFATLGQTQGSHSAQYPTVRSMVLLEHGVTCNPSWHRSGRFTQP